MHIHSIPNVLSILRIILTVPVVITLLNHNYAVTLFLFLFAGITDALDGWFARRYLFQSRLGSILDPAADKILLVSSFITLYIIGLLPLWLLLLIFMRDFMIVSAAIGYLIGSEESKNTILTPSKLSKISTVLQIILVLFLITTQLYPLLPQLKTMFFVIMATVTALSGADYAWIWIEKIISQEKTNKHNT